MVGTKGRGKVTIALAAAVAVGSVTGSAAQVEEYVDRHPPNTKISKGPKKRIHKRHVKFEFGGSEPGVRFECKLDDREFEACTSPRKYRSLERTAHVFQVRAVDKAGNPDPTPADRKWTITKKPKR